MKLDTISTLASLALFSGLISTINAHSLQPRRTNSMLISNDVRELFYFESDTSFLGPPAIPNLPSIGAATAAASTVNLNLNNIQGDILQVFSYNIRH
jgi:hypothetical protein